MSFKIRRAGKDRGAEPDDKSEGAAYKADVSESDESDGDVVSKAKEAAGRDLLDAFRSGDPHEMFAAHAHASRVHATHGIEMGDADKGDGPMGASEMVASIRGEKKPKKDE